ncbi:hypothetical protein [Spirulina sp. 06S082]|uniref:hypothetical protein n=1 Tax=Spirulina sp. 06S082 TaxID=3110248 RepID=UPI002B207FD3|nr:hypothetical protein [Spirulina sp. 06S082]MEA5470358.1 hypothetical protein [Spirulina sp. 06S082]
MISYNDIQTLIAEIDKVLPRDAEPVEAAGSLAEDKGAEGSKQEAVLAKIRWYLLDLRNQIEITPSDSSQLGTEQKETAKAIADAVMAQLNVQRQDWLQPLQMEVEALRQQRESILQEIRTLEGKHLQLMSDFLQILLGRCSKALQQEFALSLEKFEAQLWQLQGTGDDKVNSLTPLKHLDRLQQLRSLQQQADFLVLNLDSTFRKVFASLERDMESYQRSLSQGIEQMHVLGKQGETVLAAYLQRLNPETAAQIPPLDNSIDQQIDQNPSLSETGDREDTPVSEMSLFPFAGMEIPETPKLQEGSPQGWDVEEEGKSLESVDALFQVDIEGEEEKSLLAGDRGQGEAWEAWDEHLFHSDELMSAWEEDEDFAPIVLTLKESELEVLSGEESPVPDLFAGLPDPAIAAEETTESLAAPPTPDTLPSTVEAALFGEPVEETMAIAPEIEDIPQSKEQPLPETDSQTLEEIVGETIASLTELLEEKSAQSEPEEEIIEEETISVTQGETLLATDEVRPQPQEDLEHLLDSGQLKTLTEDLANFEGNQAVSEVEFLPAEFDIEEENSDEEENSVEDEQDTALNVKSEKKINFNSPEIEAEMEVDEFFDEAFEEEIITEEDDDWILPESAIAPEMEQEETAKIKIPPEAILTSLADLSWDIEAEQSFTLPASSLEIVVDDDFPSPPPQQVVKGARMGQDALPVMRSPTTESKFVANSDDDLWDSPEAPRKGSAYSQNSQDLINKSRAIEDTNPSVTEIAIDPWSETLNSSERKQKKEKDEKI